MNLVKRPFVLVFLTIAGLLIASMVFMYQSGAVAIRSNQKMIAQLSILKQLEEVESTLKDMETGQRGYLLTGEDAYLAPYHQASLQMQKETDALRRLAANGDLDTDEVARVIDLITRKKTELEQTIQIRRETGLTAALVIVRNNIGKETMDATRSALAKIKAGEQAEFSEASQRAGRISAIESATFVVIGILNLLFLAWVFRKISREMSRREAAVLEISRQKELLNTTLASIGDAVIVTDATGCVTFLNSEAEQLTGWKNFEAQGQTLPRVFHIIKESNRAPAENPAEKVLRLEAVVGQAEHTMLLAKNGSQIPIDHSAAPIRHSGGPIVGIVLVFRDFTEQREAQRVLARSKEDLEKLVVERTARLREMVNELQHVSYSITHDMRAPLRAMNAFAGLLLEEAPGSAAPARTEDYSRRILTAASRLDKLIQDALHYTKAVLQEISFAPVDLSKLIPGLVETYPNLQPARAEILIENKLPVVLGNESLLTQCFSNLLGNAVKFVAPGVKPKVCVRTETTDSGAVKIWIQDNGIGIPKHAQSRLFGMFQKLDNQYEGTGIGLALARKVTERMGGKIGVESEPGRGSRFWVELRPARVNLEKEQAI
jgi:PAS domain S-box-containing protein